MLTLWEMMVTGVYSESTKPSGYSYACQWEELSTYLSRSVWRHVLCSAERRPTCGAPIDLGSEPPPILRLSALR